MRIQGIIHQNISQLKWYILASLGLVMALPIENTIISIIKKEDPFVTGVVIIAVMITPLLAGLFACVNVQADLSDIRYIFWRSKPVNIKYILTIKYLVGLLVSFFIIACPFLYGIISAYFTGEDIENMDMDFLLPVILLVSTITYTLCFASNIFIRNTARAWLIGMLITGFFFILPFLLPLNLRDYNSLLNLKRILIIVPLVAISVFILSLFAAQHDWYLKTNLKGLLWVIAGIVFVLFMFFSTQVANIKVLDEIEIQPLNQIVTETGTQELRDYTSTGGVFNVGYQINWETNPLDYDGDKIVFRTRSYVNADNNISFSDIKGNPDKKIILKRFPGYYSKYPYDDGRLIKEINGNLYYFEIQAYYQKIKETPIVEIKYSNLNLCSYKLTDKSWVPVSELDLSECINEDTMQLQLAMRLIGDTLFAFVENSLVEIDVTNPDELQIINMKKNVINRKAKFKPWESQDLITVPILPVDGISMEDKIKLSIDYIYNYPKMYESSIVDIQDNKILYCHILTDEIITCSEVINYDDEYIYCRNIASRRITILEEMLESRYLPYETFVKDGKFYLKGTHSLMVFDIRSNNRIRKLGHFVRMDYRINDMAVAENGNILIYMSLPGAMKNEEGDYLQKLYMCLLKAP